MILGQENRTRNARSGIMSGIAPKRTIAAKIYALVVFMALVGALLTGLGVQSMRSYEQKIDHIQLASQSAVIGERLNGLALAVVMDSRGIYMSRDADEVARFARPMLANIALFEQQIRAWRAELSQDEQAQFADLRTGGEQFIAFRTELARLAQEVGPAAARAFGDNIENRTNREQLNKAVVAYAAKQAEMVETLAAQAEAFYEGRVRMLLLIGALGTLGAVGFAILLARMHLCRPIMELTEAMSALATDRLEVDVPSAARDDEIGQMARSVAVFKQKGLDARQAAAEQLAEQDAKARRVERLQSLMEAFEEQVQVRISRLTSAALRMESTSDVMSTTSDDTDRQSSAVATAVQAAASSVQSAAVATSQLAAAAKHIGRQVLHTADISRHAVDNTQRTNVTVQALAHAAQRVEDVVALISTIAKQTNLLALNATIEAARAGSSGRGFAVVAQEVKALADQTHQATGEIAEHIDQIQRATREAVSAIQSVGMTIEEISGIATNVASSAEEQQVATQEIARSVELASRGTETVSVGIQQVHQAVSHTRSAAALVLTSANELAQNSDELRQEVDTFLAAIKAA